MVKGLLETTGPFRAVSQQRAELTCWAKMALKTLRLSGAMIRARSSSACMAALRRVLSCSCSYSLFSTPGSVSAHSLQLRGRHVGDGLSTHCTRFSRDTTSIGNASQGTPPFIQLLQLGSALSHFCFRWRQRVQARSDRSRLAVVSLLALGSLSFFWVVRVGRGMVTAWTCR